MMFESRGEALEGGTPGLAILLGTVDQTSNANLGKLPQNEEVHGLSPLWVALTWADGPGSQGDSVD